MEGIGAYKTVLILVLMEDTLRVLKVEDAKRILAVLILVLMEDILRDLYNEYLSSLGLDVLNLVLMEDTLRVL